jgi:hypothetical protein
MSHNKSSARGVVEVSSMWDVQFISRDNLPLYADPEFASRFTMPPVRTLADMSEEEIAALEAQYGARVLRTK